MISKRLALVIVILSCILSACGPIPIPTSSETPTPLTTTSLNANSVVILVIDDFGPLNESSATNITPAIPPTLTQLYQEKTDNKPTKEENCLATPSGQGHSSVQGIWTVGSDAKYHGELVYDEIDYQIISYLTKKNIKLPNHNPNMINSATINPATIFDGEAWARKINYYDTDLGRIHLIAIDTDGFTTNVIAKRIKNAIDDVSNTQKEIGTTKIVLNMSFAIIPCTLDFENREQFEQLYRDDLSDASYEEMLLLFNEDGSLSNDAHDKLASNPTFGAEFVKNSYQENISWLANLNNDPLHQFLLRKNKEPGVPSDPLNPLVVSVAAAGNIGRVGQKRDIPIKHPLAPAMWENVVSVSAPPIPNPPSSDPIKDFIPNPGEVEIAATLSNPQYSTADNAPIGTSFSAPKISFLEALYLLKNDSSLSCAGSAGPSNPPLNYSDDNEPDWSNNHLDIIKATDAYCEALIEIWKPLIK